MGETCLPKKASTEHNGTWTGWPAAWISLRGGGSQASPVTPLKGGEVDTRGGSGGGRALNEQLNLPRGSAPTRAAHMCVETP